jgi:hypothetical protein
MLKKIIFSFFVFNISFNYTAEEPHKTQKIACVLCQSFFKTDHEQLHELTSLHRKNLAHDAKKSNDPFIFVSVSKSLNCDTCKIKFKTISKAQKHAVFCCPKRQVFFFKSTAQEDVLSDYTREKILKFKDSDQQANIESKPVLQETPRPGEKALPSKDSQLDEPASMCTTCDESFVDGHTLSKHKARAHTIEFLNEFSKRKKLF